MCHAAAWHTCFLVTNRRLEKNSTIAFVNIFDRKIGHGLFLILGSRKAQKGVFNRRNNHLVLQRQPFYIPNTAVLLSKNIRFAIQNKPFWSVKRLCLQTEKALFENEESVKKTQVSCYQPFSTFRENRVFAALDFSFRNNATTEA